MPARTRQTLPLDPEQARRLSVLGDRLGSILRIILNEPPLRARPLRDIAASLRLDFSTCQRLSKAAACPDPLRALCELPGPQALSAFLEGLARVESAAGTRRQAARAVAEYAKAIQTLAGSQAKLKRRIALTLTPSQPGTSINDLAPAQRQGLASIAPAHADKDPELALRRQMHELAAHLLRASVRGFISINALGPCLHTAGHTELGTIAATLGYHGGPGAHPLIAANFRAVSGKPTPTHAQLGRLTASAGGGGPLVSGTAILEHFCSSPVPPITSIGRAGRVLHVVDVPASSGPVDIVTATRAQPAISPLRRGATHETFYFKSRQTIARGILDVYLHRTLASSSIASSGVLQTDPSLLSLRSIETVNAWEERLPTAHNLQQLGYGLNGAGSDLWTRHTDAARELFARLEWNPDEFILHRLDVSFPVWSAFYYIDFDFRSDPDQGPEAGAATS